MRRSGQVCGPAIRIRSHCCRTICRLTNIGRRAKEEIATNRAHGPGDASGWTGYRSGQRIPRRRQRDRSRTARNRNSCSRASSARRIRRIRSGLYALGNGTGTVTIIVLKTFFSWIRRTCSNRNTARPKRSPCPRALTGSGAQKDILLAYLGKTRTAGRTITGHALFKPKTIRYRAWRATNTSGN